MPDNYFYDIHCHVFNLSHPNLLLFVKSFVTEKKARFITRIAAICLFLAFSIVPILFFNKVLLIVNTFLDEAFVYIFVGISTLAIIFLIAPSLIVKYFIMKLPFVRKIVNLLSVMENNLGDYLLLMEKDIVDIQNAKHITIEDRCYEKVILTPLMMDFGNKWLSDMKETIYYDELSTKPIVDQVIDLFNGIKEYCRSTGEKMLLVFPFLGMNTQNYDCYNETTVTVRERINLSFFSALSSGTESKLRDSQKDIEKIISGMRKKIDWVKTENRHINKLRFKGKMSGEEKKILFDLFKDKKDKEKIEDLYRKSQRTGIPYVVGKNDYEKEIKEKIDIYFASLKEALSNKKLNKIDADGIKRIFADIKIFKDVRKAKDLGKSKAKNKTLLDYERYKKIIDSILKRYKLDEEGKRYRLKEKLNGIERFTFRQVLDKIGYTGTTVKSLLDKYFGEYSFNDGKNRLEKLKEKMGGFNGNIDDPVVNYNYFFAGIKVYPALGFDPWPEDRIERRKVKYLYSVCSSKNIPITSHGSLGGFQIINKKVSSEYTFNKWESVIKEFPDLKLNLAHFGALKYKWAKKTFHLMVSGKNVYTDFSCNCNKEKDYGKLRKLVNKLCKTGGDDKESVYRKILFGSDFMIDLLISNSYKDYFRNFIETKEFKDKKNHFCHENPERFLFG